MGINTYKQPRFTVLGRQTNWQGPLTELGQQYFEASSLRGPLVRSAANTLARKEERLNAQTRKNRDIGRVALGGANYAN